MARLPVKIVYKFYGCGVPKRWAIQYLTLSDIHIVSSRIEEGEYWLGFGMIKRHHIGLHALNLIYKIQASIYASFGLFLKCLNTHVCETKNIDKRG